MKHKWLIFTFLFLSGYIFLITITFVYNNSLEKDFNELSTSLENNKYSELVDSKGNMIVYNQEKYEAWVDLGFMKSRNDFKKNKYLLNQRFSDNEIENIKFLKWGSYDTYEEAYIDLGILNKYARIYPVTHRVYNELFSLDLLIGKTDRTTYGIEPFLLENGILDSQKTVSLSIDLKMQQIAYEELQNTVKKESAEGGIVVVMESKTGKIKASVSLYPWNIAYMGYIEPGSTLKPLLISTALDEHIINPNDKFYSGYEYYPTGKKNFKVTESQGYGMGEVRLKETLTYSSNIAIAQIMEKILEDFSNQWFYQKLLTYGFGKKTGIEFKGEINGVVPYPDDWYEITPFQIALGQGIGITPIQLISAFNVIPNDGKYVKPTFLEVKEISERQVISEPIAKMVKEWLSYTVIEGTARKAYKEGLKIGGKTGTAQKAESGLGYVEGSYYSLYVGFYPVVDPIYTAVVIIDNPKEEFYGGEVAAPVLTNIFYRYATEKESIAPQDQKVFYKDIMPDLIGHPISEAYNILLNLGIEEKNVIITGNGDTVFSQSVPPYNYLNDSEIIQLHTID
ncbi:MULTISPECIES: penicillin-binding transpeptidase domain-containing protein [Petrotoga]|uniref:Cell division protein FtsI (Penicillin-binding protein 3) n=1 Tax=Petrotoga sibirica TaxID=156202 RepID=A0A4R8F599_9BACT|nr:MULTISPECIES: penicillin-binding transpeptidase domain-containing protein [Petrotoga]TDX17331.1 cell division protein FtsI (penicillin-binding protein 3) [Petrotoga sibirica]